MTAGALLIIDSNQSSQPQARVNGYGKACHRFAVVQPLANISHHPAIPDLPPARTRAARDFYHAVHTLILDEHVASLTAAAGFDTVVQVFPWWAFHPEPNRFDWHVADAMVREAHAHGLDLVIRLDMPPAWARLDVNSGIPFDLNGYAAYVDAIATRYRGRILGYIIWNEPNLAAEWSRSGGDLPALYDSFSGWVAEPADYVGVVGMAQRLIRAADPDALVVAGGLAPTNEHSPRARDDRDFLTAMLREGAAACFDVLAVHAYGYGLEPTVVADTNDALNFGRIEFLQTIMEEAAAQQPLWITEIGYTITPGSQPSVNLQQQAVYLTDALIQTRTKLGNVSMFTIWNMVYNRKISDEMSGYSLLNQDGTPRLAYFTLAKHLTHLSPN